MVHVRKRTLSRQIRHEPCGRPCLIGTLVQRLMNLVRQVYCIALCDLQQRLCAVENVHANHRHRHLCTGPIVRGEAAAAEIAQICRCPVGRCQHCLNIIGADFPPRLHDRRAIFVPACTGAVQSRCTAVDQVDKAAGCPSGRCDTCHTLYRFRTPVGSNIGKDRCRAGEQFAEQHCRTIQAVIFGCQNGRLFFPVPVKAGIENGFGEVAVGEPVCPHTLSLKAAQNCISTMAFFCPAHFQQLRIAEENVLYDQRKLNNEFPFLCLFFGSAGLLDAEGVDLLILRHVPIDIIALRTIRLYPRQSLFILVVVIDAQMDPAENFSQVYPFCTDSQILLEKV